MGDTPGFIGNSTIWSLVPDSCGSRVDPNTATDEGADRFYRRWSSFVQVAVGLSVLGRLHRHDGWLQSSAAAVA